MESKVKGYKVFNPDWTCRGKQYSCPGNFEEDVTLFVCNRGMHFCKKAADCFNYYKFDPNNHVAEVVASGNIVEYGDKYATDKLEIIREIPWAELLEIVNTGEGCTGLCNSGNRNSGNCNSGDWNKTNFSNGCFNTAEPKIYLFNKPSNWTYRDWLNNKACHLMNQIQGDVLKWICLPDMSDGEKTAHRQKDIIMSIPNFDNAIFKEITGVDVDKED